MSAMTPIGTKMDSAYNQNIDTQFVEDVMSDIELNWSALEREDSIRSPSHCVINSNSPSLISPISPHHLHPMSVSVGTVDEKYIIQKYSEIQEFHSDVTISCESDIGDLEAEARSIS